MSITDHAAPQQRIQELYTGHHRRLQGWLRRKLGCADQAADIHNLTDKTYIANCTYGCFYGEPRRATLSATYRW